jgi:aspartyl aminopeptidase
LEKIIQGRKYNMEENNKKTLLNVKKSGWLETNDEKFNKIFEFCNGYMEFLNRSKTEREFAKNAVEVAKANGFEDLNKKEKLNVGDKVYFINRGKSVYFAIIGKQKLENGLHIVGAHIDSPRLDLKPNPLYEDGELAYFNTHYYGGIKKYQWTTIPLSIHGVIIKANGEKITINIGEDENDPIFTITDLLPHLAQEQSSKKLKDAIEGENLDLLVGSIPILDNEAKQKVKLNVLRILNEKYGITEADFVSSELELVPAFKARSLGFDYGMVAAYGQDDKVCSYTALKALMEINEPEKTSICILSDKEEIGSMGNTGMESHVFDYFVSELLNKTGENRVNLLDKVFCYSKMLSSDVDAGFDPLYANVSDRNNAGFLSKGITLNKYTGARGKSGASDANAEYVAWVRNLCETNDIKYQVSELGKVDIGGGGTIAYILANKGVDVIDCGVPVLSMHAPYEVTSKFDIYEAYRTYKAFWNKD